MNNRNIFRPGNRSRRSQVCTLGHRRGILLLFLVMLCVVLGVSAFLWSRGILAAFFRRGGSGQAVELTPERVCEVPSNVLYFQQKDPRWAGDHLGEARDTMASSGCLVCALAAGLGMQENGEMLPEPASSGAEGQEQDSGHADSLNSSHADNQMNSLNGSQSPSTVLTAGELNRRFSQAQVYTDSGAVIWNRIPDAVPGAVSYVAEDVNAGEIDRFLADGIFPVVKVRVGGTGAFHWVLLVGADENGYLCMDPLKEDERPVPLEEFQNKVYAMRAVYRSAEASE